MDDNFHPWKLIPNLFSSKVGGNKTIFHFDLQLSEACLATIKKFLLFTSTWYKFGAKVSKQDPIETSEPAYEICKEVLWNNSCIIRGGKSLCNQYFITKGIMCIIDIMDEKGNLLEWEKAEQKYYFNMFSNLSWLGLIKSIPAVWKSNLRNSFSGSPPRTKLQNEDIACIDSTMAYLKLIQPLSKPPTSQLYFEKVLGFGKVEWKKVYMLPRIVTIDSSLRSFSIKFLITLCTLMNDYINLTLLTVHYAHSVKLLIVTAFKVALIHSTLNSNPKFHRNFQGSRFCIFYSLVS